MTAKTKAVTKQTKRATAAVKTASKAPGQERAVAAPARAAVVRGERDSRSDVQSRSFDAALERAQGYLGWTIARVPFDVHEAFAKMLRLRVKGTIASPRSKGAVTPFRTSLFPVRSLADDSPVKDGAGAFFLLVNKAMQQGAKVQPGDVARFTLEADLKERPAELPDGLAVLLDEVEGLRAFYDGFSESWRREIGKWIHGVKSPEAQLGRCEQMAERLLNTMEAEVELPPLIERAFRLRPKARAGWAKMTPTQRRQGLLAVFYYRTPESQQRRLDKLCASAEARA